MEPAARAQPSQRPAAEFQTQQRGQTQRGQTAGARQTRSGATARPAAIASLRRNVQSSRRFNAGAYQPPRGYSPRRWSYGDRLPGGYYARNYWITDYLLYSLFAPPPGLVWVRVGPDALLIDEYTGEVIQVEYGVFY
jgi:Ni/Co efflux regulator RcnB